MLFDSHCHLQDERLTPHFESVMGRAAAAGVTGFACCGTSESDWQAVCGLAACNPGIHPAYGLHPWYVPLRGRDWLAVLRGRLEEDPSASVGEIGLDHAIEERDDADQLEVFRVQLELARELHRPVSIHCRRAWGVMVDCLKEFGSHAEGIVLHSYSGSGELVPELAELGARFSFSGSITLSGNRRGRRAVALVPRDRLLVETDSPDLMPHFKDMAGAPDPELAEKRINEPANLRLVLDAAAEILGTNVDELEEQLWQNSVQLFAHGANE